MTENKRGKGNYPEIPDSSKMREAKEPRISSRILGSSLLMNFLSVEGSGTRRIPQVLMAPFIGTNLSHNSSYEQERH